VHPVYGESRIGDVKLKNRFIRSATFSGLADEEGNVTDRLIEHLALVSRGGVGLIVTGHMFVCPRGRASKRQLSAGADGLSDLASAVHEGGCAIFAQISHAGLYGRPADPAVKPLCLSRGIDPGIDAEEAGKDDLGEIVRSFAWAARRVREAGFDGVQLHGAHGYLLSQSLSPRFNRRVDGYGGTTEGRARLLLEVVRAVRGETGPGFAIALKINGSDYEPEGLTPPESRIIAGFCSEVDMIEVSGGLLTSRTSGPSRTGIGSPADEAYFTEDARVLGRGRSFPLALVGGIRSPEVAENIIDGDVADFISLSRPLIREPDLVAKWASGARHASSCDSNNRCFRPTLTGRGVYCVTKRRGGEGRR
jgi:2,4-dienoyl-CoA reductase-like NADH-dependent reductase (Old Yellow Enzyme family)